MKKTILLFFILITGVNYHASAQQFKTALDYHNYVAREQENVVNAVIYFTNHFNSKDSVLLDNYSKTKDILKKSWEHIQKMPSYEGDSELLNAAIPLFEMYYSTMNIEYHEMVDLFIKKDFFCYSIKSSSWRGSITAFLSLFLSKLELFRV